MQQSTDLMVEQIPNPAKAATTQDSRTLQITVPLPNKKRRGIIPESFYACGVEYKNIADTLLITLTKNPRHAKAITNHFLKGRNHAERKPEGIVASLTQIDANTEPLLVIRHKLGRISYKEAKLMLLHFCLRVYDRKIRIIDAAPEGGRSLSSPAEEEKSLAV